MNRVVRSLSATWPIVLLVVACAAPAGVDPSSALTSPALPPAVAVADSPQGGERFACPVSQSITELAPTPPADTPAPRDPRGYGPWFRSTDGALWVEAHRVWVQGAAKVHWIKPVGARVEVAGRRLDAEAPPLFADVPEGYPGDFQSSAFHFPTGGCWELTARAGQSSMRFVIQVSTSPQPPAVASCNQLADVVRASEAVIVGRLTQSADGGREHLWQEVSVQSVIRSQFGGVGDRIVLLQPIRDEPVLDSGRDYVLFLHGRPWRTVCANRALAEVRAGYALLPPVGGAPPLWSSSTIDSFSSEIRATATVATPIIP